MMWLFPIVLIASLVYICWHLWCLLPGAMAWKILVVVSAIIWLSMLFVAVSGKIDRMPMPVATAVYETGTSSLIILLYVFMAFLLLDVGRLLRLVPKQWLYNNGYTFLILFVILLALFIYGNIHYKDKYRRELTLTTTKTLKKPLRIVMLSDLHLGYHNGRGELHRWINIINAEKPDVVLIAGDIIDMSVRPLQDEHMADEFQRLNAPVYACLGNHEYYSGEPAAQRFIYDAGINLLQDEAVEVGDLCIIGRDDRTNCSRIPLNELVKNIDKDKYSILLDHQPYSLEQAEKAGVDFQFSGHTHYGQIWPVSWITDAIYECAFGQHQRGNTRYYVSSGMGIWGGKYRIGTCSEYVVAELRN